MKSLKSYKLNNSANSPRVMSNGRVILRGNKNPKDMTKYEFDAWKAQKK